MLQRLKLYCTALLLLATLSSCDRDEKQPLGPLKQTIWEGTYSSPETPTRAITIMFSGADYGGYTMDDGDYVPFSWFQDDERISFSHEYSSSDILYLSGDWWILSSDRQNMTIYSMPPSKESRVLILHRIH